MENFRRSYWFKMLVVFIDVGVISLAFYGSYLIRFDFDIWEDYRIQIIKLLPVIIILRITAFYYFGGYRGLWRYTSLEDLLSLLKGVLVGSILLIGINYFRNYPLGMAIALIFFASAVVHRSMSVFRSSKRILLLGVVFLSILILVGGVYAFTILTSAPISIASLPFGNYLVAQDFQYAKAMPRSVLILESILCFLIISGVRVYPRLLRKLLSRHTRKTRRVLIFGAGDSGENLVRAMVGHPEIGYHPVGFVDDHPAKQRASIHGVPVLGNRGDFHRLIQQYHIEEVLIAISHVTEEELREVALICWEKRIPLRRMPGFSSLLDSRIGLQYLEEVDIEKLLGRTEVELDRDRVVAYLQNQVVLVTGAGGSIGSELCRQVGRCEPRRLILMGKGENSIYHIQKEMTSLYPSMDVVSVIGDIRNEEKVNYVFETYVPKVVFHAAAHKHVPFMEENPEEAVLNNIFGTRVVAQSAIRHQVDRFVLISTDKAVALGSVMGASKRIAEMLVQRLARNTTTRFVTVRFGNVLGSRGSVLPLFERQIQGGGPITVTHPDMVRYFMSIPEAVRLVLHSGAIGQNRDLCILDMGQPMRILELAENMIIMAGKRPYEDIDIVFTGLRPGEVLAEELFTMEEAQNTQKIDKIMICHPEEGQDIGFEEKLEALQRAATMCRRDQIIQILEGILPNYRHLVVSDEM